MASFGKVQFDHSDNHSVSERIFYILVFFVEIYNEEVMDLLVTENRGKML